MGDLLKAVCRCGYQSGELAHGYGFSSGRDGSFYTIGYCETCSIVDTVDGREATPTCEHCHEAVQIYRAAVSQSGADNGFADADDLTEKRDWHCPKCKQPTLTFQTIGLWD